MLITTFFLPFQHFYSQKQGGNVDFFTNFGTSKEHRMEGEA